MTRYGESDLISALCAVGLGPNDLVFVHSSLFALGFPTGFPPSELPRRVHHALRSVIGPRGTLVVPTFNFDFCRGLPFDRQQTPAKKMGAFSEYLRRLPTSLRSAHPFQSIAAEGPLAETITDRDTPSAFEPGSSFDLLIEFDAEILLLGSGFEPISLVHWAEEQARVPYRYWKDFTGLYRDKGQESRRTYRLFARDLKQNPSVHLAPIQASLEKSGELSSFDLGVGQIQRCAVRDFAVAAMEILHNDPNALLRPLSDS